ncbi:tripartite tricarboxylate transporter TctB family protein [Ancylobacter terrae]|uniref:tripartite tricarboxylate transporter TctB family protein n=1 Tax=Ancylobacter sp. sgz301288 TaxID=3342077 RepID=UPI00385CE440
MRSIDIVAALCLAAICCVVLIDTWQLPYWADFAPGPAFAARWIAGGGLVISAALFLQAITRRIDDEHVEWPDRLGARQVALCIGLLVLFLLLVQWLGIILCGFLFVFGFTAVVARRTLRASIITSVVTVAVLHGVFVLWLGVDLPKGVISF